MLDQNFNGTLFELYDEAEDCCVRDDFDTQNEAEKARIKTGSPETHSIWRTIWVGGRKAVSNRIA